MKLLILKKYKEKGYNFTLHNYFPPPEKSFVLNIASDDKKIIGHVKSLLMRIKLSAYAGSSIYGLHAGYLSKAKAKEDGMFEFDDEEISYSKALKKSSNFISNMVENFDKKCKFFG